MKYFPLVWAGVWRKPVRTFFTILSIIAAFALFGTMTGLNAGFAKAIDQARLDRLMTYSRFGGPLPMSYLDQIAKVTQVTAISPWGFVAGFYQDPKNFVGVMMRDDRANVVWPEYPVSKEQLQALAKLRTGIIVSTKLAATNNWKVGDKVAINSQLAQQDGSKVWTFDVVAIAPEVPVWVAGYVLGNYAYFDEARATNKGTVNGFNFLIRDPNQAVQVSKQIDALFANAATPTRTLSEKLGEESGLSSIVDIQFLTFAITGASMFMLLFLTINVMAQSVRERIPEFAVLKTLGFSDKGLLMLVVAEAAVPCFIGAAIGLGICAIIVPQTAKLLPPGVGLPLPDLSASVLAGAFAMAVVVAFISAAPSAWRVNRLAVVDALAGR